MSLPEQVNVMVMLYTLIRKSIGLILSRNTGLMSFLCFLHLCRQIPVKYLDLPTTASLQIFSNSLFTLILIFNTPCCEIMRSYNKPQKKMRILSDYLTILLGPWWIIIFNSLKPEIHLNNINKFSIYLT
jgi:hypothetical protein